MSDYCPTCRHSTWSLMGAPHVCQPKWRVWNPDHGHGAEDGPTIYARDAESAAAEGAERMDMDGDYDIVRATEAVLHVRPYEDDDDSRTTVFNIEAESVPQYRATEKRP